jgi:putative PEP-CTERM system histidine kinase
METNLTLSFAVGAVANLVLTVAVLFFSFVPRVLRSLAMAAFVSAIWCLLHTLTHTASTLPPLFLLLVEMCRNGAWIHVLTQLSPSDSRSRRWMLGLAHLPWLLGCAILVYFRDSPQPDAIYEPFLWISMCVTISGLVAVEQAYRHTLKDFMEALRFIYFGIAGLFVFDLYFYAQTLLMEKVSIDTYTGRGAISVVVPVLIIAGLNRLQRSHLRFQVSRHLAFYTSSLIMTGTMLVMMAIGSFYVREFGGSWGAVIQTALLFAGTVLTLTTVTSSRVRAHLRVVISKHLFRHRYDYREEWLRLIQTLTSTSQSQTIYTVSIKSLAQIFDARGGVLWTLHDNKEFIPAANLNAASISEGFTIDNPVVAYMEQTRKVIVADEYTRYPQYYPGLELPKWMHTPPLWLIVPLLHHDKLIGIIALTEPSLLRRLSWEDFDILKTAGLQIASFLANEQTSRALLESRQFDAYSRLTAFIMHDLKNLIAQQSLVVKNAAKHKDNPAFVEDAINTIDNSVKRMSRLLDQLRQGNEQQEKSRIHVQHLLMEAVRKCYGREPRPSLRMVEQPLYVETSTEQLSMIIGHVIRNAQDATPTTGFIDVTLSEHNGNACIEVEDNGVGMSQEFIRERLFRPFDTTKSSKGMGIGAYQTREFIRQAGGNVEIQSQENVGTKFTIYLPLCELDAGAAIQQSA